MNYHQHIPAILLVCLLLAGSITSCRDAGIRDALVRAEALMESDPHAARAVLDSIDPPPTPPVREGRLSPLRGKGKGVLALYALLRTQADYKCRVRLTSDSLPLIATDYYGTRRKTQRAALAQHYLGCTYFDMHRDLDAIDALLRATTLFPDTTNKYFANSLFELGILYSTHHMQDSAWVAFSRYRQTEVCNSDSINIGYADYYMGTVALYHDNDELTDSLFRCVERNTKVSDYIRNTVYFQLAKLSYYKKHDIEGALAYLDKLGNYFGKKNGALLTLKADIFCEQQQPEKAFELYKEAIKNSSDIYIQCSSYDGLAGLAPLVNKGDSTRFFINQYKDLLDTIITQSKQKEIAEIKDMHIVELHDQQLKARHTRFMLWMGIVLVAVVAGAVVFLLQADRRRKKHNLQLQEELRQANVALLQAQNDEQPADMDALYRNKLAACQNLFRSTPSARLLLTAPDALTSAQRQALMDDLTRSFVDIMMDIKNAAHAVNDQELLYCILTSLQSPTTYIAALLNTSDSTLRTRKSRLKEKMPESLFELFFS
jgi:tetratricopeptide (TPR) repeat protein